MRKIIAGMFITLDGVVEAPEKWNPPYYDDELNQAVMPLLADAGTHLYGRRSYELFRAVFTGPAAPPHAALMTAAPKVVVSATLGDPGWGPTTVISRRRGRRPHHAQAAARRGHHRRGQRHPRPVPARSERLLDELQLFVHPVVAGAGRRLFERPAGAGAAHARWSPVPTATASSRSGTPAGAYDALISLAPWSRRCCASLITCSAAARSCQPRTSVDLPGSSSL